MYETTPPRPATRPRKGSRGGDLSLELRRCEMADTIRRHLFRHDRAYRVELDGDEYEVKTADFTRNDGGKIRFTASFTA